MMDWIKVNELKYCANIILLLVTMLFSVKNVEGQGLQFFSNDSLINKRTSFNVFKYESPQFKESLTLQFELSLWDKEHFGYILNVTDKHSNSYSLTYSQSLNGGILYFNIDGKVNKLKIPLSKSLLKKGRWVSVKLYFNLKKDAVSIRINNLTYLAKGFGFGLRMEPQIFFGKNERYTDVPNMAIKNLKIFNQDHYYDFPLIEWEGNVVYTRDGSKTGLVTNPKWLINDSFFWKEIYSTNFRRPVGLNFNANQQQFIFFGPDSLFKYDISSNKNFAVPYSNPLPFKLILGKNIISANEDKAYVYEINSPLTNKFSIASLDLSSFKWESAGKASLPEQRHHHNVFLNTAQNEIYLFGGYGNLNYFATFYRYSKQNDSWSKVNFSGDKIEPRFFSASGPSSQADEVYIFGGYGNHSGKQVVGGVHFYDLFNVNLKNKTIKKIWEIKPGKKDFVPANNLILSKNGLYFYALCYPHEQVKTDLKLYRFSIANGAYEVMSGNIPMTSERIESDVNLFFNEKSNQFFCAIQEFTSAQKSSIRILSLSNPPVAQQVYLNAIKRKSVFNYTALALISLAVLTGFFVFRIYKKKSQITKNEEPIAPEEFERSDLQDEKKTNSVDEIEMLEKSNAIYLLGDFVVFNKNFKNITYLCSPKIQQLFVLILLNSLEADGVTSKKISSCLWPEKEISETKNIKGVTMNHLRNILNDMEGLTLIFQNDTYRFLIEEPLFCDYLHIQNHFKNACGKSEWIFTSLKLLLRGGLLPFMLEPWIDGDKNSYESAIIDTIEPEIEKYFYLEKYNLTVDLTRVLLNVDPFNDEAIKYQVKSLRRIKGIDFAQKSFKHFRDEYLLSLGASYPISFEELCSGAL